MYQFTVNEALSIALKARSMDKKNKKSSYALNMVCSLIEAQHQLNRRRYCQAFKLCDAVRNNKSLEQDLNKEAQKIVFD